MAVRPMSVAMPTTHPRSQRNLAKTGFDMTSSRATEGSILKMSIPIVSTLENLYNQCLRESTFLSCANPCSTLSQTASYN
ncbi:hypothetical protein PRIPAC_81019 [Pristionchus pacificus]|uniref:Uncharacterized protein n=1 Tax=Pristionchus pacificus TaxID=54126 RepID=A0A2A6CJH5_PRIPA|nr:hypothetical protein PRIPAC_81019 [Pristionchus pacificus]|eukprot:PDM78238.1 hypothetical protein PRIPAC_30817 [Pristionchus pacificus]